MKLVRNSSFNGKPDAGNLHVRFDEGENVGGHWHSLSFRGVLSTLPSPREKAASGPVPFVSICVHADNNVTVLLVHTDIGCGQMKMESRAHRTVRLCVALLMTRLSAKKLFFCYRCIHLNQRQSVS
jgi:hypothetical protein